MDANIKLDEQLLNEAKQLSHIQSTDEVIQRALDNYVKMLNRKQILDWPGKVHWDGDLDQMRTQK